MSADSLSSVEQSHTALGPGHSAIRDVRMQVP